MSNKKIFCKRSKIIIEIVFKKMSCCKKKKQKLQKPEKKN